MESLFTARRRQANKSRNLSPSCPLPSPLFFLYEFLKSWMTNLLCGFLDLPGGAGESFLKFFACPEPPGIAHCAKCAPYKSA